MLVNTYFILKFVSLPQFAYNDLNHYIYIYHGISMHWRWFLLTL